LIDRLIEDGKCVTHRAIAGFGEQGESVLIGFELLAATGRELPRISSKRTAGS